MPRVAVHPEQAAVGAAPQHPRWILQEAKGGRLTAGHRQDLELAGALLAPGGGGIQAAQALAGGEPVAAIPGLEEVIDHQGRQAQLCAEADKGVAVEAGQALGAAEPHEPVGVPDDAADASSRQAIGSGEGGDG